MAIESSAQTGPGQEPTVYSTAQIRELTGLPSRTIRYFERHGLVMPERVLEHGRQVRSFTHDDLIRLKSAAVLSEAGAPSREILNLLQPDPHKESILLTEPEEQVVRAHYGGRVMRTYQSIADELGMEHKAVIKVSRDAVTKLVRSYLRRQEFARGPKVEELEELMRMRADWVEQKGVEVGPACPDCGKPSTMVRVEGASYLTGYPIFQCPEGKEFALEATIEPPQE